MTVDVRWGEGFEHYSVTDGEVIDDIMKAGNWAEASFVKLTSNFRTGRYALMMTSATSNARRVIGADSNQVGVAWSSNLLTLPGNLNRQWSIMELRNGLGQSIVSVQVMPNGKVRILGYDGTVLVTSTRAVSAGFHNHFELRAKINSGVSLRVNGNDAFVLTATNNLYSNDETGHNPGARAASMIYLGNVFNDTPMATTTIWDDIIVYTWADGDAYVGLYGAYYLRPVSDGFYTGWTASTGTNRYAMVNTLAPDGDSTFDFSGTVSDKQSFTVEPLPTNITNILAIQNVAYGRKTDSGPGSVKLGVRSGTTNQEEASDQPLLTNYGWFNAVFMTDPATSTAWNPLSLPQVLIERTV